MKELVLKKQNELEQIYSSVHMDADGDLQRQMLIDLIDSGLFPFIFLKLCFLSKFPRYLHKMIILLYSSW